MTVYLDIPGLHRLREALSDHRSPIAQAMLTQWAMRYRAYAQQRFSDMSRGGWPALKSSTIRRKERSGSRTPDSILRDRGFLYRAFDAVLSGQPGQYERQYDFGVEVGIGGSATYPSGPPIAKIATIHQMGEGRMPKREIVVEPPSSVLGGMVEDARRALSRL